MIPCFQCIRLGATVLQPDLFLTINWATYLRSFQHYPSSSSFKTHICSDLCSSSRALSLTLFVHHQTTASWLLPMLRPSAPWLLKPHVLRYVLPFVRFLCRTLENQTQVMHALTRSAGGIHLSNDSLVNLLIVFGTKIHFADARPSEAVHRQAGGLSASRRVGMNQCSERVHFIIPCAGRLCTSCGLLEANMRRLSGLFWNVGLVHGNFYLFLFHDSRSLRPFLLRGLSGPALCERVFARFRLKLILHV